MIKELILSSALLFTPIQKAEGVEEPTTSETTTDEDWENAKNTVIEWTTDTNNNGIPDKVEEIIDSYKNTELIGGMTIGSIATVLISLLGLVVVILKYKKKIETLSNLSKTSIDTANSNVSTTIETITKNTSETLSEMKSELEAIQTQYKSLETTVSSLIGKLEVNNKTQEEATKAIQENSKTLADNLSEISRNSEKVDLLLDNQVQLACNNDKMVSKGLARTFKSAVEQNKRKKK